MSELHTTVIIEKQHSGSVAELSHKGFVAGFTPPNSEAGSNPYEEEIKRLRSHHLDYDANSSHWKFLLSSYEGGRDYVAEETLFRHQREQADDYRDRKDRAQYQNYCAGLVDFVPEFIYAQEIDREPNKEVAPLFDVFKGNVDRNGTSLKVFMQQVAEDARIFGHTFVQVDKIVRPEELSADSISVQQAQEYGLDMPYLVSVKPLEVLDWRTDQSGNYLYIKRIQYLCEEVDDTRGFRDVEVYYEWWPTKRRVSRIDITDAKKPFLVGGISMMEQNYWGVVPFVPVFYRRSKSNKDMGVSFLQDIAGQNQRVFNLTSLLDEFLYRQCFNILTMERDSAVPFKEQVEGQIGTSNVLDIPRDAKHRPEYLAPPADSAQFMQSERQNAIAEMYRQAAQDVMQELFAERSGDSMKQGFARTVPVIAKMADVLEGAEQRIMKLWARVMGKKWTGKIAYKDDYSITNLTDLLLQLSTIFNNLKVAPPTFVREEWKRVIREFDGKISSDVLEKIIKEINAISDDDIKMAYATPQDIKASMGVPSTANLTQGREQKAMRTDKRRSLKTGDKSSTKEANADAPKRSNGGRALTR